MTVLILGLLLWYAAHLFKRLAPGLRAPLGDKGKGIVALALLGAVILMIIGYRSAETTHYWAGSAATTGINNLLMVFALYFVTPGPKKGALFYKMRHPMLTGFLIWVVAHLLVNGDTASLVLFGGLGLWSLFAMVAINRAEPDWQPGPKGSIGKDVMFLAISLLLVGVIGYIHTFFGLMPFGA